MDEINLGEFHCLVWRFLLIVSVCTNRKRLPVESILMDVIDDNKSRSFRHRLKAPTVRAPLTSRELL